MNDEIIAHARQRSVFIILKQHCWL